MDLCFIILFLYSQLSAGNQVNNSPWDLLVLAWLRALGLLCLPGLPWEPVLLVLLELLVLEQLLPCLADQLGLPGLLAGEELPDLLQVQGRPDLGLAVLAELLVLPAAGLARLLLVLQVRPGQADLHGRQERAVLDLSEAADLLVLQLAVRLHLLDLRADQQGLLVQGLLLPVQLVGLQGLLGLPGVVDQEVLQADLVPWEPDLLDLLAVRLDLPGLPDLLEVDLVRQAADLDQQAGLAGQL